MEDVTAEYIKTYSCYKKDLAEVFKPGLRDLSKLEEIQSSREESTLHMVFMEEIRVSVGRSVLKAGAGSFDGLMGEIKDALK